MYYKKEASRKLSLENYLMVTLGASAGLSIGTLILLPSMQDSIKYTLLAWGSVSSSLALGYLITRDNKKENLEGLEKKLKE
ncbi:MAG: hypothetical protein QW625_03070 [Candidatus Nanoarchaeia archaeon]